MGWKNVVGLFGGGSFAEWFGSLEMDNADGSWNVEQMEIYFKNVIESSRAGYVPMRTDNSGTAPPPPLSTSANHFLLCVLVGRLEKSLMG